MTQAPEPRRGQTEAALTRVLMAWKKAGFPTPRMRIRNGEVIIDDPALVDVLPNLPSTYFSQ